MHPPGPWGSNRPVAGAKVRITDIDAPGRGDDLIWEGTTGADGRFAGTSEEWRDRIRLIPSIPATPLTPAVPATYGPDPTDVLVLKLGVAQGSHNLTAPFAFAGDSVEVPMFVTWGPPSESGGSLNGVPFTNFEKLINQTVVSIAKKERVELKLRGDWSLAAKPLVDLIGQTPLERTRRVFPESRAGSVVIVVGTFSITVSAAAIAASAGLVLAIGGMILLAGAATLLVCLGIAVILAVVSGYARIEASQKTTTDSQGNPSNETTIILGLA